MSKEQQSLVMLKRVDGVANATGCRPRDEVEADF